MDMMEGLLCEPDKPLCIAVTSEGSEFLKMRSLAKEAIPMLLRPETHSLSQRSRIAVGFKEILEGDCMGSDEEDEESEFAGFSDENNTDYEPGECSDWPEKEWD